MTEQGYSSCSDEKGGISKGLERPRVMKSGSNDLESSMERIQRQLPHSWSTYFS